MVDISGNKKSYMPLWKPELCSVIRNGILNLSLIYSEIKPEYLLIEKHGKIEIRQYSEYVIAKTSIKKGDMELNNNMFRTLARYIFGGNYIKFKSLW